MEKGLEISFEVQPGSGIDDSIIVKALAGLTWLALKDRIESDYRIFRVTKEEDRFFKILFGGPKLTKMHPLNLKVFKEKFDELSKQKAEELVSSYKDNVKKGLIQSLPIKVIHEEYDFWEDPIWQYI